MIKYIKIFLDWWNKFSSRLKSLGYLIAVIFLILFIINNGLKRNHIEKLIEKTTGLNIKNDILMEENNQISVELAKKDSIINLKQLRIDSLSNAEKNALNERDYWKGKHDNISEDISKIPNDSSYKFLQSKFNYPGSFEFPFNGPQIKGLHRTYLENENKKYQLFGLENALADCQQKNTLYSEMKSDYKDKNMMELTKENNYKSIITNKNKEVELLRDELKRNGKWFAGFGLGLNLGVSQDLFTGNKYVTIGAGIHYNIYKW